MNRRIDCLESLCRAVQEVVAKFGRAWWRGQPAGEPLLPSAFRCGATQRMEARRARRFMLQAGTRHSDVPAPEQYARWLFLMQHYGLPTRLLDWTESPLIATYFAVEKQGGKPAYVWALDPDGLNESQFPGQADHPQLTYLDDDSPLVTAAFLEQSRRDLPDQRVLAVFPPELDLRMLQQQSVFTLHGGNTPIEELENNDFFLTFYEIPATASERILKELDWLGIRASTLFPDLTHLAGDVCRIVGRTS